MTSEHPWEYLSEPLPEIDQHKFSSIIQAYKNALVPRTVGDSHKVEGHLLGLNESPIKPAMVFPEVLHKDLLESSSSTNHELDTSNLTPESINTYTDQPNRASMDESFRKHLHSENIPHAYKFQHESDSVSTVFNVEGIPTEVHWDAPSSDKSLDFPHIVQLDSDDKDGLVSEYTDEHEYLRDHSALNPERKMTVNSSGETGPARLDPQARAGGYLIPAHLAGRGTRGRFSHFNTGRGMSEITGEDDIELNPKKGYSKWG